MTNLNAWTVHNGIYNDTQIILRLNEAIENYACHPDFSYHAAIAIPFLKPDKNGFPLELEDNILGSIEDTLVFTLEQNNKSILVAVVTTGGMREFVFYTSSENEFTSTINIIRSNLDSHELQLFTQEDKDWKTLESLLNLGF